jgi:hypothetical protein
MAHGNSTYAIGVILQAYKQLAVRRLFNFTGQKSHTKTARRAKKKKKMHTQTLALLQDAPKMEPALQQMPLKAGI